MKGKFGVAALLFSSMAFAGPVSTPNNVNDTPIISGGGSVSGGGICKAYQTDGTAVNLSGGETLVFYGTGSGRYEYGYLYSSTFGGYLSTKPNYSGPAYVKVKGGNVFGDCRYGCSYLGSAIGLFAQNTDSQNDFIAGAGAGGTGYASYYYDYFTTADYNASSGGGWQVMGFTNVCRDIIGCSVKLAYGGTAACPYSKVWFITSPTYYVDIPSTPGFCGSVDLTFGGASSISAWYNSYTKDYTSFGTSLTISGGGYPTGSATIYVCQ
jgi:hypothetical protein